MAHPSPPLVTPSSCSARRGTGTHPDPNTCPAKQSSRSWGRTAHHVPGCLGQNSTRGLRPQEKKPEATTGRTRGRPPPSTNPVQPPAFWGAPFFCLPDDPRQKPDAQRNSHPKRQTVFTLGSAGMFSQATKRRHTSKRQRDRMAMEHSQSHPGSLHHILAMQQLADVF